MRRGVMTARLDLLAHGATAATRAARFPDDEALEAPAVAGLERSAAGSDPMTAC